LFYFLGLSFLAGLAVFALSLLMNVSLSRVLARFQKRYMKKQDARVSMTSETLNNIKTIKLYSWIEKFIKIIDDLRNEELSVQWWRMNILMITLGSLTFFPLALQTASFSTYIGTGNVISLPVAYTLMTIFNIINGPIRMLPMFLGQLIEFTVAMKRI
jgi:ABC-type multidrug transport system fused ATPase/permease subunit